MVRSAIHETGPAQDTAPSPMLSAPASVIYQDQGHLLHDGTGSNLALTTTPPNLYGPSRRTMYKITTVVTSITDFCQKRPCIATYVCS